WDQIEFAYTNGSENGYFKSVLLPENGVRWTESIGNLMTSSTVANFDSDGNRYLLVKNVLTDKSVLVKGGKIRINIIYWAFNGSHGSVCKYSASASASPSEEFTLVGDPAGKTAEEIANEAAADAVVEKINAIPATVTENDEDVITDARAAYDSLTAKQKELIPATSYNKLTDAEQVLISLNYKICALPDWKADITDLSVWEGVASNSLTYEFQRAADYTGKIGVTFQIMWDYATLYVLVKTDDATVSEADQIEFAYNNGEEPAYFNTSVGGWQSSAGTLMDSTQLKTFTDNNGYRYILTRHIIADKTVLETGNSLSVNVLYRDFTEDTAQLCIYSFSSSASPSVSMKLTGTPDVMSEEEKEAIKQIEDCIDLIVALPLEITLESETAVSAAKTAYDALTDEQKAEISDRLIDALNTAVNRIAELKAEKEKTEADEAAANAVVEKIDAIGEVTVNSKEAIDSARNAYDALTEDQKAYVSEEKLAVLVAAEIEYTSLEASEGTSVDDSEINAENGCFAGVGI
ncbi:MAG: hypothetical protein IJU84_01705, partial [Clostridia bacterium]|nr:hypothetical protein [Clostridia bacterium]